MPAKRKAPHRMFSFRLSEEGRELLHGVGELMSSEGDRYVLTDLLELAIREWCQGTIRGLGILNGKILKYHKPVRKTPTIAPKLTKPRKRVSVRNQ